VADSNTNSGAIQRMPAPHTSKDVSCAGEGALSATGCDCAEWIGVLWLEPCSYSHSCSPPVDRHPNFRTAHPFYQRLWHT
jgi:hypothetical protein